jgi:hypothetical protein
MQQATVDAEDEGATAVNLTMTDVTMQAGLLINSRMSSSSFLPKKKSNCSPDCRSTHCRGALNYTTCSRQVAEYSLPTRMQDASTCKMQNVTVALGSMHAGADYWANRQQS